jgi:hypothetical protein
VSVKINTDGFTDEKCAQKKIPIGNILSVMVAYAVNIFQLSVKYQRNVFICEDVGDCGISGEYFSTLCEIPTEKFRLDIRR